MYSLPQLVIFLLSNGICSLTCASDPQPVGKQLMRILQSELFVWSVTPGSRFCGQCFVYECFLLYGFRLRGPGVGVVGAEGRRHTEDGWAHFIS